MQRLADHAAGQHVLHRDALLVVRLGVVGGVFGVDRLHVRHLFWRGAVVVHVAHEAVREILRRAALPEGAPEQRIAGERGTPAAAPGAADANLRVAVHRAEDGHRLAQPRFDHPDGDAHQRLGGGATALAVHVEVQPNAEVASDGRGRHRVVAAVGEHPVDVLRGESSVFDGLAHRRGAKRPRRGAGAPRVASLAHPDDGVLAPQVLRRSGVDVCVHAPPEVPQALARCAQTRSAHRTPRRVPESAGERSPPRLHLPTAVPAPYSGVRQSALATWVPPGEGEIGACRRSRRLLMCALASGSGTP